MTESAKPKVKKFKVRLDVDIAAKLTGFDTAKSATAAHRRIMNHFASVLLMGPPASDSMLELMAHMFTEDEADAAQHLPPLRPRTARRVARLCGRPEPEVASLLNNLADVKHVIAAWDTPRKYTILPIVPGTFEMAIMTPDLSRTNHWHKRFAELFEDIWDSGYMKDYVLKATPPVRYLPVSAAAKTLATAWPADKLEQVLEPYDQFAIGHCQCRVVTHLAGKGCGKPTENCVAIGPASEAVVSRGLMRTASRQDVLDAKRHAEEHGCVTWMMNGNDYSKGSASCSCCGCCCHALRTITQFSAPGMISRPHFMPQRDEHACTHCGLCVAACPMAAWSKVGGAIFFDQARCIGCGICTITCKENALSLHEVPDATPIEKDLDILFKKSMPAYIANAAKLWLKRTIPLSF
jgi:Pyruvate/2-oxoacid:ferredoxin oxidoreductase delta subunit